MRRPGGRLGDGAGCGVLVGDALLSCAHAILRSSALLTPPRLVGLTVPALSRTCPAASPVWTGTGQGDDARWPHAVRPPLSLGRSSVREEVITALRGTSFTARLITHVDAPDP